METLSQILDYFERKQDIDSAIVAGFPDMHWGMWITVMVQYMPRNTWNFFTEEGIWMLCIVFM